MSDKKTVNIDRKVNAVDELFEDAKKEVNDRIVKEAKSKIIVKLEERAKAAKVLSNIDREIAELKLKIKQDLGE